MRTKLFKIIALSTVCFLFYSCCKKEKCPKLSDEMKNFLPYKDGELIRFVSKNFNNKTTDTVEGRIRRAIAERNYPCANPKIGGKCDILSAFFFEQVYSINTLAGFTDYDLLKFNMNYQFNNVKNDFQHNFAYSDVLSNDIVVNGKTFFNVKRDSISYQEEAVSSDYKTVILYTKNDGVLKLRKYSNDVLFIEMIKL